MLIRAAFVLAAALVVTSCHLYIEDDDEDIGDPPFEDDWEDWEECGIDNDCPAGCTCDGGVCIETGEAWCSDDLDCWGGGACVEGVCVDVEPECFSDADCETGAICDPGALQCRPAQACGEHQSAASCEADSENLCEVVNRGINCTHPEGGDCATDPAPCTCESFEFAACVEVTEPASDPTP